MWMRMAPPGRASTSQTGIVKRCGPHHFARCFGSVHALNTSSRGASKTRVISISRSAKFAAALFPALLAAMFPLLLFQRLKIVIQTIEALIPEAPVAIDPVGDLFERHGPKAAGPSLRLTAARNQPGAFEHFEVLGDGRRADDEGLGEFLDRGLALGEARHDGSPSGVGEGGEGECEAIDRHLY